MGYNYDSIWALLIYSLLLGIALGFVYDFFRAIRFFFSQGEAECPFVIICICDVLFFVCSACIFGVFLFVFNRGRVRITALPVALCGFLIYLNTIGKIVVRVNCFLFALLKRIFIFLVATVIGSIFRFFWRILCKSLRAVKKFYDYLFTRREMFRIIKEVRKL